MCHGKNNVRQKKHLNEVIQRYSVVVLGCKNSPCTIVRKSLQKQNVKHHFEALKDADREVLLDMIDPLRQNAYEEARFPQCYVLGKHVGGAYWGSLPWHGILRLLANGRLEIALEKGDPRYLSESHEKIEEPRVKRDFAIGFKANAPLFKTVAQKIAVMQKIGLKPKEIRSKDVSKVVARPKKDSKDSDVSDPEMQWAYFSIKSEKHHFAGESANLARRARNKHLGSSSEDDFHFKSARHRDFFHRVAGHKIVVQQHKILKDDIRAPGENESIFDIDERVREEEIDLVEKEQLRKALALIDAKADAKAGRAIRFAASVVNPGAEGKKGKGKGPKLKAMGKNWTRLTAAVHLGAVNGLKHKSDRL